MKIKPIEGGKEIAQEVERHKIKRLTQEDILNAALKHGDSIVVVAQRLLDTRLAEQLEQGGVAAAIPYCQPENYEEVQALQDKFGAFAHRTAGRLRNPQNRMDDAAGPRLAHYAKGTIEGPIVTQELDNNELLYTSPIYVRNETCLNCHGTVGKEVAVADYELIKQKYPQDRAINFREGDLQGIWTIRFDKKELVAFLNDQPKKSRRPR
ncbi:c-type heme family protein [Pontibacter aquaedesilientis]|uniref:c-type heme family protein n=1 Tax=Pontibacter aquaedesilientis TaxID=2766980 RepID=UPI00293BB1D3|nr:DUF3365 domain-containing protein [Pontibacter aquaedesilientis]